MFSCCKGRGSEETSRADSKAALSPYPSEHPQKLPCHSPHTRVVKTSPCKVMNLTSSVCPGKVSCKEHLQKPICVNDETSTLNISYLKCVDKGLSPISIPSEKPVGSKTSPISIPSVEQLYKGSSSVSIPDKKYRDRETSPIHIPSETSVDETSSSTSIPSVGHIGEGLSSIMILGEQPTDMKTSPINITSVETLGKGFSSISIQTEKYINRETCIRIPSGKSVDKCTSPVSFQSQKLKLSPCKENCTDICTHSAQISESLHGMPLGKAKSARSIPNLKSTRQETALPEQTGTVCYTFKTHLEELQLSDKEAEPLDTALPVDAVRGIDTETQTDAVRELMQLHSDKNKKNKQRKLVCLQSHLDDEPSSSPVSQQEDVQVQQEAVTQSPSLSSHHANTTQTNCTTASTSSVSIMYIHYLCVLVSEDRAELLKFM